MEEIKLYDGIVCHVISSVVYNIEIYFILLLKQVIVSDRGIILMLDWFYLISQEQTKYFWLGEIDMLF